MKRIILAVALVTSLIGCASQPPLPQKGIVVSTNGFEVRIKTSFLTNEWTMMQTADETCNRFDKDVAGPPISKQCLDGLCLIEVQLFLCKSRTR